MRRGRDVLQGWLMVFTALAIYGCGEDTVTQPGTSSQCIGYEDYLHIVGSVDTPSEARGVAVSGDPRVRRGPLFPVSK